MFSLAIRVLLSGVSCRTGGEGVASQAPFGVCIGANDRRILQVAGCVVRCRWQHCPV